MSGVWRLWEGASAQSTWRACFETLCYETILAQLLVITISEFGAIPCYLRVSLQKCSAALLTICPQDFLRNLQRSCYPAYEPLLNRIINLNLRTQTTGGPSPQMPLLPSQVSGLIEPFPGRLEDVVYEHQRRAERTRTLHFLHNLRSCDALFFVMFSHD